MQDRSQKGQERGPSKRRKKGKVSVKSQIRSLQRLLKKDDVGHKLRKAIEAKIEGLEAVHQEHKQSEKEKLMAVRYHRVKFFERVKLERRQASLRKQIEDQRTSEEARLAAVSMLEQCKSDLQYVMHFPKGEKYVSILKEAADPEAQAALDQERGRLRRLVQKKLADERMLSEVNEGKQSINPAQQDPLGDRGEGAASALTSANVLKALPSSKTSVLKEASNPHKRQKRSESQPEPAAQTLEEDDFFLGADEMTDVAKGINPQKMNRGKEEQRQPKASFKSAKKLTSHAPLGPGQLKQQKAPGKLKSIPQARQKPAASISEASVPKRTRAEGGRKRKKKQRN